MSVNETPVNTIIQQLKAISVGCDMLNMYFTLSTNMQFDNSDHQSKQLTTHHKYMVYHEKESGYQVKMDFSVIQRKELFHNVVISPGILLNKIK